jgi:mRNA interferase RelE/StbE
MAGWRLVLLRPARNYLQRLPVRDRDSILDALEALVKDPGAAPVKKLKGRPEWSLRVGPWRVLLMPDPLNRVLVVTLIGPRGDVYK